MNFFVFAGIFLLSLSSCIRSEKVSGEIPEYMLVNCELRKQNKTMVQIPGFLCRVMSDGKIISYVKDKGLVFFNPDLSIRWERAVDIHHDIDIDEKNRLIAVVTSESDDFFGKRNGLRVYDFEGNLKFRWTKDFFEAAMEHLIGEPVKEYYEKRKKDFEKEKFHFQPLFKINSVHIIRKDESIIGTPFVEGNLLFNIQQISTPAVININTGKVVWFKKFSQFEYLSGHSFKMMDDGKILFFRNYNDWKPDIFEKIKYAFSFWEKVKISKNFKLELDNNEYSLKMPNYSTIEIYDPRKEIFRQIYKDPYYFNSYNEGAIQILENGHLLISHNSYGSGAFEIDLNGRVYFKWLNKPVGPKSSMGESAYNIRKLKAEVAEKIISGYF